jgi:hypothetical protein
MEREETRPLSDVVKSSIIHKRPLHWERTEELYHAYLAVKRRLAQYERLRSVVDVLPDPGPAESEAESIIGLHKRGKGV